MNQEQWDEARKHQRWAQQVLRDEHLPIKVARLRDGGGEAFDDDMFIDATPRDSANGPGVWLPGIAVCICEEEGYTRAFTDVLVDLINKHLMAKKGGK